MYCLVVCVKNNNKKKNNGNLYSAGIHHEVALIGLEHHCVHQTYITQAYTAC